MTELGYTMGDVRAAIVACHEHETSALDQLTMLVPDIDHERLLRLGEVLADAKRRNIREKFPGRTVDELFAETITAAVERGILIGVTMAERKAGLRP